MGENCKKKQRMKPPQGPEQKNGDYRHKESEPRQQPSSNRKKQN